MLGQGKLDRGLAFDTPVPRLFLEVGDRVVVDAGELVEVPDPLDGPVGVFPIDPPGLSEQKQNSTGLLLGEFDQVHSGASKDSVP
ncbi:hypothetical protein SDC9_138442 [bioreactor metagenome]|uniref:Uncharacterized protein n=1 Tax=bioreactor metagenome TaxID=1076179 RepID=A0A645DPB2_9ZZZZ